MYSKLQCYLHGVYEQGILKDELKSSPITLLKHNLLKRMFFLFKEGVFKYILLYQMFQFLCECSLDYEQLIEK